MGADFTGARGGVVVDVLLRNGDGMGSAGEGTASKISRDLFVSTHLASSL